MRDFVYSMRIVKGALTDPKIIEQFPHRVLEVFQDDPNWDCLIGMDLNMEQIHMIQKLMVRHYETSAPWYMDGVRTNDPNKIICAFGADDGEDGKVFEFDRNDEEAFKEVVRYALSKGIPPAQVDFL